jgi:long-chain acyl-CoA synthetase
MAYSSGTTGLPKGIMRPLPNTPFGTPVAFDLLAQNHYGFGEDTIYLCPAPLYHAAPLGWSTTVQALGGTVVLLRKFDPEGALRAIQDHHVTAAQFVPTHFVRLLRLPDETRRRYDLSSLRMAVHAAAPITIPVKTQMLDWWGPIIHEFYAGSEGAGFVAIGPEEWLRRPGSVGRPLTGNLHVYVPG